MTLNKHIVLIGMSGAGKSTLARALADTFNLNCYDTDQLIESAYELDINNIWKNYGEFEFRVMERKVLFNVLNCNPGVVATGGGLPIFFDHMHQLKRCSTVYLKAEYHLLLSRIAELDKPLFKNDIHKEDAIKYILNTRQFFYNQAELKLDAGQKTEQLVNILGRIFLLEG